MVRCNEKLQLEVGGSLREEYVYFTQMLFKACNTFSCWMIIWKSTNKASSVGKFKSYLFIERRYGCKTYLNLRPTFMELPYYDSWIKCENVLWGNEHVFVKKKIKSILFYYDSTLGLFWKSLLLSVYPCLFTAEYTCTCYEYQKFWCFQLYQGNSQVMPPRACYQLCQSGGQVNKT